jgi:hypothetical protein
MPTCKDCGRTLSERVFAKNRGTRWRHTRCNQCRRDRERAAELAQLPPAERQRREAQAQRRREVRERQRRLPPGMKVCLGCDATRPLSEYVPIKTRPGAYYPRCRVCRREAERKRYYSKPDVRAAEIERSRRNHLLRQARAAERARALGTGDDHILLALSRVTGLERSVILGADRAAAAEDPRMIAAFLLRTEAGLTNTEWPSCSGCPRAACVA